MVPVGIAQLDRAFVRVVLLPRVLDLKGGNRRTWAGTRSEEQIRNV